jgi:hypothetical protein
MIQSLTDSITRPLPLSGLNHLADLALYQIAFQGADVTDVKLAM